MSGGGETLGGASSGGASSGGAFGAWKTGLPSPLKTEPFLVRKNTHTMDPIVARWHYTINEDGFKVFRLAFGTNGNGLGEIRGQDFPTLEWAPLPE